MEDTAYTSRSKLPNLSAKLYFVESIEESTVNFFFFFALPCLIGGRGFGKFPHLRSSPVVRDTRVPKSTPVLIEHFHHWDLTAFLPSSS